MDSPVWFCGAPADPVAEGVAERVAALGVEVAGAPAEADRAVVVLSPALAAADPPALRSWLADRGTDAVVLAVSGGRAEWDEEADRFAVGEGGEAVPPSLRQAVRQRPFVIDVRGADAAKLDRCARRIAGAVSTDGPPEPPEAAGLSPGPRRSPLPAVAAVLVVLLLGAVGYLLAGGGSTSGTSSDTTAPHSSATTSRIPTSRVPTTTAPVSDGSSSNAVAWVIIAVLATALAVTLVMLKRRPKVAGPAPPAAPVPVAAGAPQVFVSHDTEADGRVARQLVDQLRRRRLEAWIAPESIPPGEPWVFAIEQGLTTSRAALVLVSPAALASGWVRREIQMIVDLEIDGRIHVVPVRVAPCDVPLILTAYQWVDVADFERAADSLARRFAAATAGPPTGAG